MAPRLGFWILRARDGIPTLGNNRLGSSWSSMDGWCRSTSRSGSSGFILRSREITGPTTVYPWKTYTDTVSTKWREVILRFQLEMPAALLRMASVWAACTADEPLIFRMLWWVEVAMSRMGTAASYPLVLRSLACVSIFLVNFEIIIIIYNFDAT